MRKKPDILSLTGIFFAVVFVAAMGAILLSGRLVQPDASRAAKADLPRLVNGGLVPAK